MNSSAVTIEVDAEIAGLRLDAVLGDRIPELSRSLAQRLIREGRVSVNHEPVQKPAYKLMPGDRIEVELVLPPSLSAQPEDIPLKVVYRDEDLAIIDKPAGIVVHPAAGHTSGTVTNALLSIFPQLENMGSRERPGIVHRLDKDTSGLMVVALNPIAQRSLQGQIAAREASRRYLALATGRVEPEHGIVDAPIGRDPANRKRMAPFGVAARQARTSYRVIEYFSGFTYVEASLETGRTHQIRVHFQALGHPLAGDRLYGGGEIPRLDRQFLHAYRLDLLSPSTGKRLEFSSDLPSDLASILEKLRSRVIV